MRRRLDPKLHRLKAPIGKARDKVLVGQTMNGPFSHITIHNKPAYLHQGLPVGYQELHDDVNAYSLDETDVDSRLETQSWKELEDVGGGEKYVMQVWGQHLQQHRATQDAMLEQAVDVFVARYGPQLAVNGSITATKMHLLTLWNFGLLSEHSLTRHSKQLSDLQLQATNVLQAAQ